MENKILEELNRVKDNLYDKVDVKMEEMQKHLDIMDCKIQQKGMQSSTGTNTTIADAIASTIKANEVAIKGLNNEKLLYKSVYTSDVTGLKPHTFSTTVVTPLKPLINVTDLIASVKITGGSYSYATETTTGAPAIQVEGSAKADVSMDFVYATANTAFLAGVTKMSRQFMNNSPSLASTIPQVLQREFLVVENTQYATAILAVATASSITGSSNIEILVKNVAAAFGDNIMLTSVVVNPTDYSEILLNQNTNAGYDLPNSVTISATGQVSILGVPLCMASWISVNTFLMMNGAKVHDAIQESLNFQMDASQYFDQNIVVARIEKQAVCVVTAPLEVIKGSLVVSI